MPPMFLHRVWLGHGSRSEFDWDTQILEENNPEYRVTVWDEEAFQDFPELGQIKWSLWRSHRIRLEDVLGMALVQKWGGAYYGCGGAPMKPLPIARKSGPWMVHSGLVGALQPGDLFWSEMLTELTGPYFNHLKDSELEMLYLRHSSGQLSLVSLGGLIPVGR